MRAAIGFDRVPELVLVGLGLVRRWLRLVADRLARDC